MSVHTCMSSPARTGALRIPPLINCAMLDTLSRLSRPSRLSRLIRLSRPRSSAFIASLAIFSASLNAAAAAASLAAAASCSAFCPRLPPFCRPSLFFSVSSFSFSTR